MKHLYNLLLLAAMAATALPATAYDFMADGLCYNINDDGNSVTVTYQQEPNFSNNDPAYSNVSGSLTIPEKVIYNGKTYSVTAIGNYAFRGCRGFTGSLTIPNSVTGIGDYAFWDCRSFTGSLTIPNSVTSIGGSAFYYCSGFDGSLAIPNSVTTIGSSAFFGCSGFTGSLTIPNSVKTIGSQAFDGCSGFTGSLTIGNSVTSIGNGAFYGCSGFTGSLTIGNSVTTIGDGAFYVCSGFTGLNWNAKHCETMGSLPTEQLERLAIGNEVEIIPQNFVSGSRITGSLTIPNSVTTIGRDAFRGCSGFTGSLTIPNSVTTIGDWAFGYCSGFTGSLTIGNSVTSIGNSAFYGCSGFTSTLTIGNSVTEIGSGAFAYCSGFTGSLTIPNSVTTIGGSAFEGCGGFSGSLTIGNSVTEIGVGAFYNCSGFIGSLTIGDSVTEIGDWAFGYCSGFTGSLTIGNSVTSIGNSAFYGCSGFTGSLTIGNSITNIGNGAFQGCSGFTGTLTIPNSVTEIGHTAFGNCIGLSSLVVDSNNPKYDSRDNCNAVIETASNKLICGIKTFRIPNSVTTIGDEAFSGCSGFTGSLTIPNSVTTIGNNAFSSCSGFTGSLTIPSSVTTIGDYAFYNCSNFTGSLTIPNSVTTVGEHAFDYYYNRGYYPINFSSLILAGEGEFNLTSGTIPSSSIRTIYIQSGITGIKGLGLSPSSRVYAFSATPPECDENAFARYSAALHVPKRSLAAYVDAPYWCNFTDITGDAVEPEALDWEQESVSLKLGDRLALEGPFLTPANTGLDVSIVSSDPDVVALSSSYDYNLGEYTYTIQGVKVGEADLIASCAWLEARMHVTVTEDVITITLDRHEVELEAGTMVTLTPSSSPVEVEYVATSSDRSVATARVVGGSVQVVGAKPGTTVVTVSDAEGVAVPDTCRVTVVRPIGDATGDGYIDIDDVNAMINVILELVPRPVDDQQPYYDLDSSGRVDIDDINAIINIILAQ